MELREARSEPDALCQTIPSGSEIHGRSKDPRIPARTFTWRQQGGWEGSYYRVIEPYGLCDVNFERLRRSRASMFLGGKLHSAGVFT